MNSDEGKKNQERWLGVLIGGSGLIGGALTYYFKTNNPDDIEILAPSSKKLSLREPDDIRRYLRKYRPDFIINAAIAAIDSNPQLAYETNYLGTVYLASAAAELQVPYIHFSTAAVMLTGENLGEDQRLALTPGLANYPKSKLMSELTLEHMQRHAGLDFTTIRVGIVYGEHDHKIQGFHRLFFNIVNRAMPFMVTRQGVMHSYTNARKIPYFVHHVLRNRQEFSGQTYNFVDRNPVALSQLILTIRSYLELSVPKEIYIPYPLAKAVTSFMRWLVRSLRRIGIDSRLPGELMFLENFYKFQTLSAKKLESSSFKDPFPDATIYTELPALIQYYLTRWEYLNLISSYNKEFFDPKKKAEIFVNDPMGLLETVQHEQIHFLTNNRQEKNK